WLNGPKSGDLAGRRFPTSFFDARPRTGSSGSPNISATSSGVNYAENKIHEAIAMAFSTANDAADFIWIPNFSPRRIVVNPEVVVGASDFKSANSLLAVHSTIDQDQWKVTVAGMAPLAIEDLARKIAVRLPGFRNSWNDENNVLFLGICYAARELNGTSMAQRFADAAQVNVVAPTGRFTIGSVDNRNEIMDRLIPRNGAVEFRFFRPVIHL
ncbi:hypothetical protein, partial [Burkholderia ambifaria]|uniref:hypothetical protein n=1 Tax=Burkholderia ambifaria TaxID=152480 RepID=UPI000A4A7AF2